MDDWAADGAPRRSPAIGAPGHPRGRGAGRRRGDGFSLAEVLVAVLIFEVGLLASVGLLRLAAFEMALARRAEAAQWAAAALADSLVAGVVEPGGERTEAWGLLRWTAGEGGVLIEALRPETPTAEPLARVWIARSVAGEEP